MTVHRLVGRLLDRHKQKDMLELSRRSEADTRTRVKKELVV